MHSEDQNANTTPGSLNVEATDNITQKKRSFTTRETDEQATKRLKIESTKISIENKPAGNIVVVSNTQIRHPQCSNVEVELMLENQRLRLESKYRSELHTMEKDALKTVTELRTENMLLKQEISKLEKDNNNLRNRRDNHGGLAKVEVDRRRKKFPWLPIPTLEEKTQTQSKQNRKTKITDLPADLTLKILKCLSDEDLFVLRGLSTQFYEAFYSQEDLVDCERCIWLAKRGRKFANLRFIHAYDDFTWKEFRVLGPSNFPKLEILWLENSSPRLMKSHHYLRELWFTAHDYDDLQWVSDKKFPALEVLIFSMEEDLFDDHPNRVRHLPNHKSLINFGFDFCDPSLEEVKELTKSKFPRLRRVAIAGEVIQVPEILEYLQQQGIEFTDNIKKLSINKSNFCD